jgi:CRP/FNR family cyclic AMP-dependent transcriptional regulator
MDIASFFAYPNESTPEDTAALLFLDNQSDNDWAILLEFMQTDRFKTGEIVLRLGDGDRSLCVVTSGSLEVLAPHGRQGLRRVTIIETGSIVGEQSFVDGRPRSATVRALTDGEMLRLSVESFEVLSAKHPMLARDILFDLARILSLRLRQRNQFIATLIG